MKKLCVTLIFVGSFLMTYGQGSETLCGDGIDNDGDGFIDCFDGDCATSDDCEGSYIGNNASCQAEPSEFPVFSLRLDYATENGTANHIGRIAIGDLDRDGIPEIVTQNKFSDEIFVLDGATGNEKASATIAGNGRPEWRIAIGNVQDDDCGEIFIVEELRNNNGGNNTDYRITAFDCNLNELWSSNDMEQDPVHLGLADFDRDGTPELYYKNEILNAVTGEVLVNGNSNEFNSVNGGPVAVDIVGDEDLELVSGGTIYGVNLAAGTLTELETMPFPNGYRVKRKESTTSVADFNKDGFLDVITTGRDFADTTIVFFWDVRNNAIKTFSDPIPVVSASSLACSDLAPPTNAYQRGWRNGTGRLNIGDLDGDGNLNVSFVSGRFLYALDENFELLWRADVNEETSGWTGCTLFDFNGDGKMEVVYRDERWLYIIDGTDGTVFTQTQCVSRTSVEYPIVADVDADGSTEICVVCGTDDVAAANPQNFCNLGFSRNSQVRVFESNGEPWVPARRLWNQHGYFNVNVDDDLSIPQNQQKHHLIWSEGTCSVGPNRPLNGFLNQSPFLDSDGCPVYASPDLLFVESSLVVNPPACPERDFTTSFQIQNLGDAELSGDVSISFYNGDPFTSGAIYLSTETVALSNFGPGDVFDITNLTITGPGSPFDLFIVLNDNGSTLPPPVDLPNTNFLECDYEDNVITIFVDPIPFDLTTVPTDDIRCDLSLPANGTARAFRQVGPNEVTADYTFSWFDSTAVGGTPDHTGAVYTGIEAGTYSVIATHNTAFCNSNPAQVTVDPGQRTISIQIDSVGSDNCNAPNGTVRAIVNGGEPVSNFTYEWYRSSQIFRQEFLLSTSHELTGLAPDVYAVVVTEKLTGCTNFQSAEVIDEAPEIVVIPDHTDIDCSGSDIGTVSAEVAGEGTTGFTFNWYRNDIKPTPDFTGSSQGNLPAGTYIVQAIRNSTGCESDTAKVTIEQTVPPVITDASGTDMNSCDPTLPNGTATVSFTGLTNFSIEWFNGIGDNTGNRRTADNDRTTITGLSQGTYTVKLIDDNTQCFVTDTVIIRTRIVIPQLTLSKVDATICSPFNGSVTATPSVDTPSDYTFSWYDGPAVKATPDYTTTGNELTGLPPGEYTVTAVNNNRNCVVLAPQTIRVDDQTPAITIVRNTASSPATDCTNNQGEISITINRPGNTQGFNVEWYAGRATGRNTFNGPPITTSQGVTSDVLSGMPPGIYSVLVTDVDNGCSVVEEESISFVNAHTVNVTPSPVNQCDPHNGQLTITLGNLSGFPVSAFRIEVYEGPNVVGSPIGTYFGAAATSVFPTSADLSPGEYTVIAFNQDISNDCGSVPVTAEILSITSDPIVNASITNNTACIDLGGTPNGVVSLSPIAGSAPSVQWYEGPNNTFPTMGTNIGVAAGTGFTGVPPGVYLVEVTNNDPGNGLGCFKDSLVVVGDDSPLITLDINTTDITSCLPGGALADGSAVALLQGDNAANYTISWVDASNNTVVPTALPAGEYTVSAAHNDPALGCATAADVVIEDMTIGTVGVSLIDFTNPTLCLQPDEVGNLVVVAQSDVPVAGGFTYEWYDGPAVAGTPALTASGVASLEHTNLGAQEYTIRVINNDNNCLVDETYELVLMPEILSATASSSPVTSCVTPDGTVFASMVTNTGGSNYNYTWTLPGGTTRTGQQLTGLSENDLGRYEVRVVDATNGACSATASVTLGVDQLFPNLMVEAVAPLTTCDPERADGVARASVEGEIVGYTFDWFLGTDLVYSGTEFSGLLAQTYSVVATDIVNGCTTTEQVTIQEDILPIPNPTIEVISHVTSCDFDNGALSVSVDGNTSDYIFDWFNGQQATGTPSFTGEIYDSLAAGFYTVTATSRITGCVSEPVTEEIIEDKNFPEFEFVIKNASCGQEDGFAQLFITNDVAIDSVVWEGPTGDIVVGPNLANAPAGDYTVTVWSTEGCSVSESFTILPEINPYNGVSRNGDGRNDIFMIECIEDFPNNLVKIFNRSGTLVYEAEGYNNSSTVFDGVSNKGMRVIGTNLPDGTYYYVIDKRDGSAPFAGYLEVLK